METTPTDKTSNKLLNISLPEALLARTQSFCAERGMTVEEFITDAIIEKLQHAFKERRIKSRL